MSTFRVLAIAVGWSLFVAVPLVTVFAPNDRKPPSVRYDFNVSQEAPILTTTTTISEINP